MQMDNELTKLAFLGSTSQSYLCLDYLLSEVENVDVLGVVANASRQDVGPDQDVEDLASKHGIPVIDKEALASLKVDLGVSVLFDQVLPAPVVNAPPRGWVNIHLGPLPRFRGANSVFHAIRLAEEEDHWQFGVTLHYMDVKVDTGDIIDMIELAILKYDTAFDLYNRAFRKVFDIFTQNIHRLVETEGRVPSEPQTGTTHKFFKGDIDHEIDINLPADKIYDMVRALTFPGKEKPYVIIGGHRYYIQLAD